MNSTASAVAPTTVERPTNTAQRTPSKARAQQSTGKKWLLVVLVLALAGTTAWASLRFLGGKGKGAVVDQFTVTPRTFNVVMKEKGELKAAKSTDVKSEVEGRCTIISLIPEGTAVKKGDLLVQLASDKIDERIQQEELKESNSITVYESAKTELEIQQDRNLSDIRRAELDIELKRLTLERYQRGDWAQQLNDARIGIEQAQIQLKRMTEDYEAGKELKEKNYITKTQFDQNEFDWKKAAWDLEKAKRSLEVLNTYTHVVDSRKFESDLDEAIKEAERVKKNATAEENKKRRSLEGAEKELALTREQLAKLRSQKEKTRIVAPTQGFVVYGGGGGGGGRMFMNSDEQIKEGAEVYERQVLMQLPDTAEMMVVVRIHEAKTDKLRMGQAVNIEVEGFPGKVFGGKVTKIAAVADSQNRWLNPDLKEYETEITLDHDDTVLKPGTTAFAEIMVGSVENSLAIPLPSVYSKGGKRFVFLQDGSAVKPMEIQTGAVSTEWAEVKTGLKDGDNVLLAFGDDLKRMIPDVPGGERRGGPPKGPGQGGPAGGRAPGAGGMGQARAGGPGGSGDGKQRVPGGPGGGDGQRTVMVKPGAAPSDGQKPADTDSKPTEETKTAATQETKPSTEAAIATPPPKPVPPPAKQGS